MNYFIDLLKGKTAAYRLSEDKFYAMIVIEKKKGFVDEVALIRAEVEANGDDNKLDGLYVKNRIRRIKDDYNAAKMLWNELEIVLEKEKYEQRREFVGKAQSDQKEAEKRKTEETSKKLNSQLGKDIKLIILFFLILLIIYFGGLFALNYLI